MTDRISQAAYRALMQKQTGTGRSLAEISEAALQAAGKRAAAKDWEVKGDKGKTQPAPPEAQGVAVLVTIRQQPIGKPRQTRADKWKQRPAVMRYREWADEARRQVSPLSLPSNPLRLKIVAYFEMPKSWPKWKQAKLAGQPHRQKPDWDNIGKAVQDIFWQDDQVVAEGHVLKFWDDGNGARVEMEVE